MKISDVERKIVNDYLTRDDVSNVDYPCLEACLHLYDLNIGIISASCNKESSYAHIVIDYDGLSDENKEIVSILLKDGYIQYNSYRYEICLPVKSDDDVKVISDYLMNVAAYFKDQDILSSKYFITNMAFYNNIFLNDKRIKSICKEFGLERCYLHMDLDGDVTIDDDSFYRISDLQTFIKKIDSILTEEYNKYIELGLVDFERGIIYKNQELAQKHYNYIENRKVMRK